MYKEAELKQLSTDSFDTAKIFFNFFSISCSKSFRRSVTLKGY